MIIGTMNENLNTAIVASIKAGKEILKIYNTDFKVEYKEDESPLTIADKNANEVIMSFLKSTGIPVLSEEGRSIPYEERKNWSLLWIVDPLDGTKEFVKRNDEFTVNIALIEEGVPVLGVVYVPVTDELYFGDLNSGAYKLLNASLVYSSFDNWINKADKLPIKHNNDNKFTVVASRSHLTKETSNFIDELKKEHDDVQIISRGSSLKICMIAEGKADVYPRFAPTSEWDTAAGHAVVKAMGGKILQAENNNEELKYNKKDILNPWFIVYAN
jgi:3'(2'), 5'-bisphosphate nucleotidase